MSLLGDFGGLDGEFRLRLDGDGCFYNDAFGEFLILTASSATGNSAAVSFKISKANLAFNK